MGTTIIVTLIEDSSEDAQVEICCGDQAVYVFAKRGENACGECVVKLWYADEGESDSDRETEGARNGIGADAAAIKALRKRNTSLRLLGFEQVEWI